MDGLVQRATQFATRSHGRIDHRRKYTGQPYDVHLRSVARIVESVTDEPGTIAAAWLHDVVEDTPVTFQDVEREFGADVSQLVTELTDVSRPSDGNRTVRRAIDRAHLARASARAQTVKLADLIDNCGDICKHDPPFGRVFVVEMAALLDVLGEGDPALMSRARKLLEECAHDLGVPLLPAAKSQVEELPPWAQEPGQLHAWRLFARAFTTRDVARPLRSFDGERDARDVAERMRALELDVIGVREDGETVAYARLDDLAGGTLESCSRPLAPTQKIDGDASLTEMIQLLTLHDHGFVTMLGGVNGLVTRIEVQHPIARMWLFGMITLIELTLTDRVRKRWPDGDWIEHLTEARRKKAEELRDERARRGQPCELLDCLQLGDKTGILLRDPDELAYLGFETRKSAKRVIQEFQSLRNNLAHAQDIVTHDWPQIARMTARVESIVHGA